MEWWLNASIGLITSLMATLVQADATPYRGADGLIDLFGRVTITFQGSLLLADGCKRFPKIAKEAETIKLHYANVNQPVFLSVVSAMNKIALANGGQQELDRLESEIRVQMPRIDASVKEANLKLAPDESSCKSALRILNTGASNLKVRQTKELESIFTAARLTQKAQAKTQASSPQIQTAVSSQDPDGMGRKDLTMAFLRNLEAYTRTELSKKYQAYLEAQGIHDRHIALKIDGTYLETRGQKLAIIKVSDESDTSRSIFVTGFVGKELRRVTCIRASKEPIPISYGPCGEKINEAFGVTLVR
jgi:hypothetical protein